MILSSLPLVGQLYLPLLLTSLILGMIVLILLEKKGQRREAKAATAGTDAALLVNGGCGTTSTTPDNLAQELETSANHVSKDAVVPGLQEGATTTPKQETSHTAPETQVNVSVQETSASCSSSSSSGSEEEGVQPKGAARHPKKKHSCRGSAKICASKKPVTGVTVVTDTEEERVQVSLEHLAQQVRTTGLTCTFLPLRSFHQAPSITDPAHLLLLFGTTSRGCERLREILCVEQRVAAAPPQTPCMYSVTCWSEVARGDVYESALNLSAALEGCGGVEWLPLTCISPAEGMGKQSIMTEQQYINTVLKKITKPKKCCGTSCGTKNTVDIEDLATSLLPPRPTLKT